MTKKLSILSIVAVLLFSMCFIGCGDSSTSPTTTNAKSGDDSYTSNTNSNSIVGTWKFVEYIKRDGRTSERIEDTTLFIFNSDGTCKYTSSYNNKNESGAYELSRDSSEITLNVGGFDNGKWAKITKFTSSHLEIEYDGTYVLEKQ